MTGDRSTPSARRRIAAGLAIAAAAWSLVLVLTGGFSTEVAGWTLRSRNPRPAMILAALAVAAYVLAGGRARTLGRLLTRLPNPAASPLPFVGAIAVAFAAVTVAFNSRAVGGSDSYGYASEADLWLRFNLTVDQPFALGAPWPDPQRSFSPLAYQPQAGNPSAIVPIVAPGLPIALAAAKAVGGQDALFLVTPLSGALLVIATFGVGRRLASDSVGVAAAWLVATSPPVLSQAMTPMTDVPVAAAWTSAIYFLISRTNLAAIAAGTLSAFAILIRPNLAPLAAVLALRYVLLLADTTARSQTLKHACLFLAAFLPGPLLIAAINHHLFGSPFMSGYGSLADLFDRTRLLPNFRNYLGWLVDMHTPAVLIGMMTLFIPARRLWPGSPEKSLFVIIGSFVVLLWTIYCAYDVFTGWWYLRYILPSIPFFMLGVAATGIALLRWRLPGLTGAVAIAFMALGVVQVARAADGGTFEQWHGERRYIVAGQLAGRVTDPNSVVLAASHSGSVRYYGGRMTIRYHELRGPWLDRAVEWLNARGVTVYALLDSWEMDEFREQFAGASRLSALTQPVAIYEQPGSLQIFNLSSPPSPQDVPVIVTGVPLGWRAIPPMPLPTLTLEP